MHTLTPENEMVTLAVANQKGGVGKTTTTINLAGALAYYLNKRVLVIDIDPQGHCTTAMGLAQTDYPATLTEALLGRYSGDLRALVTSYREYDDGGVIDVIPTNDDMFLLEGQLYPLKAKEGRLARLLKVFEGLYDYCLIDCPPSLGPITDNAMVAAAREHKRGQRVITGGVIVPVAAEDSSLKALDLLFRQQLEPLRDNGVADVDVLGLVINAYDKRRGKVVTSAHEALHALNDPVLIVVEDRSAIREAWRYNIPVIEHQPNSDSADWYRKLAVRTAVKLGDHVPDDKIKQVEDDTEAAA